VRTLVNRFQQQQATDQNRKRDPEVRIGQDAGQPVARLTAIIGCCMAVSSKQEAA
jgi:hypothetical protein